MVATVTTIAEIPILEKLSYIIIAWSVWCLMTPAMLCT